MLVLEQPRLEHAQRLGQVLVLALFVLTLHDDAALQVREPDGRLRLVDVLSARAAGREQVLAIVLGLDVDLHVLRLGQHGHRGGRRVDSPLGLRLRHALHAMSAAFVLQLAVAAFAFDAQDHFLEAAQFRGAHVHDLDLPALGLAVAACTFRTDRGQRGPPRRRRCRREFP